MNDEKATLGCEILRIKEMGLTWAEVGGMESVHSDHSRFGERSLKGAW